MSTLAETLRAARHRMGVQLEEVERETRIRVAYLAALENDAFDELPPPVYTRGFVANYAAYLALDRDQMTRLYDEAIGYQPERVRLEAPATVRVAGLVTPNVAAIGVTVVLAGVVFVWLYSALFVGGPGRSLGLPTVVVPTPTALTGVVLPALTSTVELPTATPLPTETPAPAPSPTAAGAGGAPNPTQTSATPPRGSVTPTLPAGALALRIKIVEAPSWVQVRTDGVVVFSGTLAVGAERTFTANTELFIHAGRSDAVDIILNGVPQGRLGSSGQAVVRRTFTRSDIVPTRSPA